MKKKIKTISILLIIIQLFTVLTNLNAVKANIKEGDTVLLQGDHECDSLVEYWMTDYNKWSYKVVWYVYYIDTGTGERYPAFCVEPAKNGVGTGYTSYNTTISKENDAGIWRILSKGYMGSNWTDWDIECDDDFYTATKIAIHSYKEGVAPNDKYILGTRSVDGNTVEEIQRRGAKALAIAQTLYEYGVDEEHKYSNDKYKAPQVNIATNGDRKVETINKEEYYIQNYIVTANKYLKSYKISIENFPLGTKILDSNNKEVSELSSSNFKIAIPTQNIKEKINGNIYVQDAQVKTCPIFYAQSSISGAQSYVTYTSSYETASTSINMEVDPNNCSLFITKLDSETKQPISNVTFEITSESGEKLGEYTTNKEGIIEINNLKPGLVKIKEINVDEKYILNDEEKEIELKWGKTSNITIENERKKGDLKIVKVDKENNKIKLEGVEFELYNEENELIETLVTDKNGEICVENLYIGNYKVKEVRTNEKYILNDEEINLEIKWNEETLLEIQNNKVKGQIRIIKTSEDDNLITGEKAGTPIPEVKFEIKDEQDNVVETVITNKDGIALTGKLEKGKYIIKETKANENYELNTNEYTVEITENEQIVDVQITNKSKAKLPRTGF